MLKGLMNSIAQENEAKSWETIEHKTYRLNVIIDGLGLNREFPAVDSKDKFYQGTGKTEAEVMAMVAQAKRKGLKPTLYITTSISKRLV